MWSLATAEVYVATGIAPVSQNECVDVPTIHAHRGENEEAIHEFRSLKENKAVGTKLFLATEECGNKIRNGGQLSLSPNELSPMTFLPDYYRYQNLSLL